MKISRVFVLSLSLLVSVSALNVRADENGANGNQSSAASQLLANPAPQAQANQTQVTPTVPSVILEAEKAAEKILEVAKEKQAESPANQTPAGTATASESTNAETPKKVEAKVNEEATGIFAKLQAMAYWPADMTDFVADKTYVTSLVAGIAGLSFLKGGTIATWMTTHKAGISRTLVLSATTALLYVAWNKYNKWQDDEQEIEFDSELFQANE